MYKARRPVKTPPPTRRLGARAPPKMRRFLQGRQPHAGAPPRPPDLLRVHSRLPRSALRRTLRHGLRLGALQAGPPLLRNGARDRRRPRRGRVHGDDRRRTGRHGGRQPRRARGGWPLRRSATSPCRKNRSRTTTWISSSSFATSSCARSCWSSTRTPSSPCRAASARSTRSSRRRPSSRPARSPSSPSCSSASTTGSTSSSCCGHVRSRLARSAGGRRASRRHRLARGGRPVHGGHRDAPLRPQLRPRQTALVSRRTVTRYHQGTPLSTGPWRMSHISPGSSTPRFLPASRPRSRRAVQLSEEPPRRSFFVVRVLSMLP